MLAKYYVTTTGTEMSRTARRGRRRGSRSEARASAAARVITLDIRTYSDRDDHEPGGRRPRGATCCVGLLDRARHGSSRRGDRRVAVRRSSRRWSPYAGHRLGAGWSCSISTSTSGCRSNHPASFRPYLLERLIDPAGISALPPARCEQDPQARGRARRARAAARADRRRLRRHRRERPPGVQRSARRLRDRPALPVVSLDEACRRQQVGEGWFASVADVPASAISMSIRQIMSSPARSSASCRMSGRRSPCRRRSKAR